MNEITPAEQEELDALLAKERQSIDQQELDALPILIDYLCS